MQSAQLEFCFKGGRDYIHGTDMFNALVGVHPTVMLHKVHFTIHGFVRTPRCEVYRTDSREALRELRDVKVHASFDLGGITQLIALKEASTLEPARSYEYSEDRVTSLCDVHDHGIALKRESPFTFIETVVAMNKHMHQTLFADATGKWLFTGIYLEEHGCDRREGISLHIGHNVNYRLTRAEIVHNGQVIGNLFFSMVKK